MVLEGGHAVIDVVLRIEVGHFAFDGCNAGRYRRRARSERPMSSGVCTNRDRFYLVPLRALRHRVDQPMMRLQRTVHIKLEAGLLQLLGELQPPTASVVQG